MDKECEHTSTFDQVNITKAAQKYMESLLKLKQKSIETTSEGFVVPIGHGSDESHSSSKEPLLQPFCLFCKEKCPASHVFKMSFLIDPYLSCCTTCALNIRSLQN